ncbi:hypothetical protein WJM97_02790 [Okeanomitos corallinicola TIOX110]|uniref:Cyanovirin-N domain-containing protein n=1 Tax=Okeanomitos corallinicola TIOX110 TaxID=3133117 RepID=A0ABZ2UT99_9CYAN
MLKHSQLSLLVASFLGISTIGLAISEPASASVVCEPGTITKYPNGSLARCILGSDTTIQVASASGRSVFPCKAGESISFNSKGQFSSCTLYEEIKIRKGNSTQVCKADSSVSLWIDSRGNQDISCY